MTPAVTPSDPIGLNPTPGPAAPNSPPTAAPPAQPSMWRQVLQGAMAGLAGSSGSTSFGGGLAGGAKGELAQQQLKKENDIQAQAQASTIKFRDAQSASLVAEAANNNAKAMALPQQAKDAHDASELEKLKTFTSLGLSPIAVADDHADAAHSALEGITKQHGAVPPLANVEVGGQHYAFDLSQLAKGPQSLTLINEARQASGQDALTPAVMAQMSPASKEQELAKATTFFSPSAPGNANEAHGNLLQYQAFASAYKNNPNADPKIAARLDGTVARLKTIDEGMAAQDKKKRGEDAYAAAHAQALARQEVADTETPAYGVDKNGQTVAGQMSELKDQGAKFVRKVSQKEITDDTQLQNRLADVQNKIGEYENTLKTPLSPADRGRIAQLGQDLKIDWHGVTIPTEALNAILNNESFKSLSPEAQDRLVAYRNARESMIGYQRVLSGSGRSSEKAMELNLQALGAPSDPEGFSRKGVTAFKQNLKIAGRGLPKLPGIDSMEQVGNQVSSPTSTDKYGFVPKQ